LNIKAAVIGQYVVQVGSTLQLQHRLEDGARAEAVEVPGEALSVMVSGCSLAGDRAVKLITLGRLSLCGAGAGTVP
jgi:hypothetical protein